MSEVEAASVEIPAPRTRKRKDGTPRPSPRSKLKGMVDLEDQPVQEVDGLIGGWPIKDGFSKIMVFADPSDGNKTKFIELKLGDHPKVAIAKNRMHVLPNGLVNIILDTAQEYPVDDTSDERNPVRMFETRSRFPHSEPIPATPDEFRAYRAQQAKLIHPNRYKKL